MGEYAITRKLFIALANDQYKRRKRTWGSEANVCNGCREILQCSGTISFQACQAIDDTVASEIMSGPKKSSFERFRSKYFGVSRDCLETYGIMKKEDSNAGSKTE